MGERAALVGGAAGRCTHSMRCAPESSLSWGSYICSAWCVLESGLRGFCDHSAWCVPESGLRPESETVTSRAACSGVACGDKGQRGSGPVQARAAVPCGASLPEAEQPALARGRMERRLRGSPFEYLCLSPGHL